MFGIEHYELFILSGILLNITPGTDTIYILGRSISQGRKAGIMSSLGISSGALIHTLLAALGLSIIIAESQTAFNIVKYCGAAYLIYLGARNLFSKDEAFLVEPTKGDSFAKVYMQGVLNNLFNPKVVLFFLAFLPQFINKNNSFGPLPFMLLGLTFVTTGTVWCIILSLFSSYATKRLRDNKNLSAAMNKLTGILFVGLGLNLLRANAAH
jgi:RhtB (resistance to homoserine/threonine) family protein